MSKWEIKCGDCLDLLPSIADKSIDLLLTDSPYAEVNRDYGRVTEPDWHMLMDSVVAQAKRVLKPSGSAVFILQPNSKHVGQMRAWIWEFLVRTMKDWNLVQDVYWWNHTALPNTTCHKRYGLLRPSVKYCLWFGSPDCYRNQDEVLWTASDSMKARMAENRANKRNYRPSGCSVNDSACSQIVQERGGVTPFNLIPMGNTDSQASSGAHGHGAGTPYKLCDWWTRYACPPSGMILDPFAGCSTVGLAAINNGRDFIGFEKEEKYVAASLERLQRACIRYHKET